MGLADIDAFKKLERQFRCSDCGERAVTVESIFHPDWRDDLVQAEPGFATEFERSAE